MPRGHGLQPAAWPSITRAVPDAAWACLISSAAPREIRQRIGGRHDQKRAQPPARVRHTKQWQSGARLGRPNEELIRSYQVTYPDGAAKVSG